MKKLLFTIISFILLAPQKLFAWSIIPEGTELAEKFQSGQFKAQDIIEYGLYLIQILIEMAGIVAVILVMIGGYKYVIGSLTENKEGGKKTILHALVGFSLCVLSWLIVELVISLVKSGG